MLVVICSALVEGLCSPGIEGCVYVDGPQNATVKYAAELPSGLHTRYKLQIGWPVSHSSCLHDTCPVLNSPLLSCSCLHIMSYCVDPKKENVSNPSHCPFFADAPQMRLVPAVFGIACAMVSL